MSSRPWRGMGGGRRRRNSVTGKLDGKGRISVVDLGRDSVGICRRAQRRFRSPMLLRAGLNYRIGDTPGLRLSWPRLRRWKRTVSTFTARRPFFVQLSPVPFALCEPVEPARRRKIRETGHDLYAVFGCGRAANSISIRNSIRGFGLRNAWCCGLLNGEAQKVGSLTSRKFGRNATTSSRLSTSAAKPNRSTPGSINCRATRYRSRHAHDRPLRVGRLLRQQFLRQ